MYEGYLQHDAQEVLQCILGHIQETCQLLKEQLKPRSLDEPTAELKKTTNQDIGSTGIVEEDVSLISDQAIEDGEDKTNGNAKRKNDTEDGNEKKKSKVSKEKNGIEENQRRTRSKRKALEEKLENQSEATIKHCIENENTKPTHKKSRLRLNWLKSSSKQPSILSKFCSLGKLTTNLGFKEPVKEIENSGFTDSFRKCENGSQGTEDYCDPSSIESTVEKEIEKRCQRG